MNIIVTGNIGCGKSYVMGKLKELLPSFEYFDVDQMVHELYATSEFREFLLAACGTTDRKEISNLVFNNPYLRMMLEEESKHMLRAEMEMIYRLPNTFIEFPVYFEVGAFHNRTVTQKIVCVYCDEAQQTKRVKARNGFTDEKIEKIRKAQMRSGAKAALADLIIYNDEGRDPTEQLQNMISNWELK